MRTLRTSPEEKAFQRQRAAAKYRGIPWELSFADWLSIWSTSGHWADRGVGIGKFVMARHGDVGPYAVGNVSIIKFEQNMVDARANKPRTTLQLAKSATGKGKGWTRVGQKFQVTCARRYIGTFTTQAEAEQAYSAAVADHIQRVTDSQRKRTGS